MLSVEWIHNKGYCEGGVRVSHLAADQVIGYTQKVVHRKQSQNDTQIEPSQWTVDNYVTKQMQIPI